MKTRSLCLLAMAAGLAATTSAGAQTVFNWNASSPGNGNFGLAAFWTPAGGPPGAGEEARFNSANSDYFVAFSTDPTNLRCRIGNDHVLFNLNSHTYTLTSTGTSATDQSIMVGGITVVDDALLTLSNGTLAGQHAVIAPGIFEIAAGMVVGSGATLNLAGTFTIGRQLPGSLTVMSGGDVISTTGILGYSGAGDGSVTVTGAGSTWSNSGSVYVGGQAAIDGGNGTLSITNQGLVDVGGTLKLWPGGNVALNGGTLETENVQLSGGSFNWTSGTLRFSADLSVDPSGPLGDTLVVGAGQILHPYGDLYVGNSGAGTLNISNGTLQSYSAYIGYGAGSNGAVTVDGANASWANFIEPFSFPATALYIGYQGAGTLNIVNGGRVIFGYAVPVYAPTFAYIGKNAGSTGTVLVSGTGSLWMSSSGPLDILAVGDQGNGTLNISSGGLVSSISASIGEMASGAGTVTVDGINSRWANTDSLFVRNGTLTVTDGGIVSSLNLLHIFPLGTIKGNGTVTSGLVFNGGTVAPGTSPGTLHINGDYTQSADGELLIELASASSYDQLLVTGTATLGGTLNVTVINGFAPSPGQTFTILTADDVDGTFAQVNLPKGMEVTYTPTSVIVEVPGPPCPADIAPQPSGNGVVNVDDLLAVINAWGACVNPKNCPADIAPSPNGNGVVNVDDLLGVINAWGACP